MVGQDLGFHRLAASSIMRDMISIGLVLPMSTEIRMDSVFLSFGALNTAGHGGPRGVRIRNSRVGRRPLCALLICAVDPGDLETRGRLPPRGDGGLASTLLPA